MRLRSWPLWLLLVLVPSVASAQFLPAPTGYSNPGQVGAADSGTACSVASSCAIFTIPVQTTNQLTSVLLSLTGTWSEILTVEATNDNRNWTSVAATNTNPSSQTSAGTISSNGNYVVSNPGFVAIRLRATTYTSGNATVTATGGQTSSISGGGSSGTVNIQATNGDALTDTANALNTFITNPSAVNTEGATLSNTSGATNVAETLGLTYVYNGSAWSRLALGQALAASSIPVILPSATITTLTPPATIAVAQASTTSGQTGPIVQTATTTTAPTYTTAQTNPLSSDTAGNLRVTTPDPCTALAPTTVAISNASSTALVVISAASSKKNYICALVLVAGAAEIVNIIEGTGANCGSSQAAVMGSTTAAQGLSFAANGGFVNPVKVPGIGTNTNTCVLTSGSNRVAGYLTYVQQ